ncbi:MAG: lipopolysaccharide biosynthesis protein, partial [Prevotella sp.]|nr:lipopolysaccharide biosynthesis protein [Prevotella sp.]
MTESLKQKTAKGLFWGAMNSGSTQILNLIFGIVLGRMLSPEIYSVVAILTIFVAIAGDLQSSGFTQALVNIKRPTDRDYNSVFSFNVVMSLMMYFILFLCAPLIADFYDRPYLTEVSRVLFLSFLIASIGIAHGGYMMKNMMNKEMAIIGFIALIVSGATGITLAFLGKTYWALVWQQIAYISVTVIGKFFFVKEWRPRLTLDFGPVKQMAPFAMNILVTKIVNTVSNNILTNIFGKLFPDRLVGNYSQAYKWDTMANSLVANTVGQIAQAVLVEASPSDHSEGSKELQVFRKMLRFTCFLSMPLMFGFALVANEFILITIGDKWTGCVPLLQVLCLSGAFVPLYTMYQNLAMSQGRSDIFMWLNIGQIALQIVIVML